MLLGSIKSAGPAGPGDNFHYHRNGLYVAGYVPDITTGQLFRYPEGAPVFTQTEALIRDGHSGYRFPKAEYLGVPRIRRNGRRNSQMP
jgi:hypothetical protein